MHQRDRSFRTPLLDVKRSGGIHRSRLQPRRIKLTDLRNQRNRKHQRIHRRHHCHHIQFRIDIHHIVLSGRQIPPHVPPGSTVILVVHKVRPRIVVGQGLRVEIQRIGILPGGLRIPGEQKQTIIRRPFDRRMVVFERQPRPGRSCRQTVSLPRQRPIILLACRQPCQKHPKGQKNITLSYFFHFVFLFVFRIDSSCTVLLSGQQPFHFAGKVRHKTTRNTFSPILTF